MALPGLVVVDQFLLKRLERLERLEQLERAPRGHFCAFVVSPSV
jgi:hypothetical protein